METEKKVLDSIKFNVAVSHNEQIDPRFEYGTVWCDGITPSVANTIKSTLESSFKLSLIHI